MLDTGETHELTGKRYSELHEDVQDAINSFMLSFKVIELEDGDDEEAIVNEIFYRLNNGKTVSREHLAFVAADKNIKEFVHDKLTNHPLYMVTAHFPESSVKKSERQMSVLQAITLVGGYEWSAFGTKDIEKVMTENEVDQAVFDKVTRAFDMIHEAFPEYNKFVTKVNLVSFVTLVVNNNFDSNTIDFLRSYAKQSKKGDLYRRYCGAGGTKKVNIEGRINGLQSLYEQYLRGYSEPEDGQTEILG